MVSNNIHIQFHASKHRSEQGTAVQVPSPYVLPGNKGAEAGSKKFKKKPATVQGSLSSYLATC